MPQSLCKNCNVREIKYPIFELCDNCFDATRDSRIKREEQTEYMVPFMIGVFSGIFFIVGFISLLYIFLFFR
jgi:hypothetical protein